MRASRLVSILLLLQTRGRMTARQVAETLEVSVRTVYRDMESLVASGIPLYGEAGPDGGYQLLDGYRTRLTGLTADEARALFLTGLPAAAADLGLGAVAAETQLKLTAALPPEMRERAEQARQRIHIDIPAWYQDSEETPWLSAVASAVWNQQQVRIRYERWATPHEVTRTVDSYGVVLKAGRWYLVAGSAHGVRTYRVSRITELEPLAGTFTWPAGFDLATHWREYLTSFDTRRYRDQAVLRLSPEALADIGQILDSSAARAAEESAAAPDADGWTRVVVPIESCEQALPKLLLLGVGAEVVGPPELRERMRATLAEMLARYEGGGPTQE
ncbi:helix-turn-helix transcriptional regulator [Streptomyces noursei]|uniref:helix-turn-helix transcriptional regulator n=1 Tax=Streptomyces noursei TaxID=1971 RepID=UPI0019645D3E|nr:YafY family protein [Streptomyces noursei]QRX92118.1 YafY family transcriptional regulator [Streptomyces noursei]